MRTNYLRRWPHGRAMVAILCTLLMLAFGTPAAAAVLYKSVDREGHITFSDSPVEGAIAVQRIQVSDQAKDAVIEATTAPVPSLADAPDDAIVRANAKLDAAEHALALARQEVAPPFDNLSLARAKPTRAQRDRLEFYRRDVAAARRELMIILKRRQYFTPPETTLVASR